MTYFDNTFSGVPATAGTSSFTLQVTDDGPLLGLPQQTATFVVSNFVVLPGPLKLNCGGVDNAEMRIAFTGACSGTGGTLPYNYSVNGGNFPPGLTLNPSSGAITGVPASAGTYTDTIQLTDSGSPAEITTQQLIFIVAPFQRLACGIAPPIATSSPQIGMYYRGYPCYAVGGIAPYSYSLTGNVPPGLSIDAVSGMVTGTPTQAGTYSFNVIVADSESPVATITDPVTNFAVSGAETGTVTITATSGGITNTTTIAVTVP